MSTQRNCSWYYANEISWNKKIRDLNMKYANDIYTTQLNSETMNNIVDKTFEFKCRKNFEHLK